MALLGLVQIYFINFMLYSDKKNIMILPCSYCILPNKCCESYVEMLTAIKNIVKPLGDLNSLPYLPDTALADF